MFRTVLENIFSFINGFRLNDNEKIIETLMDGLREVLDENDPTLYIDLYFQDEFDEKRFQRLKNGAWSNERRS